MIKKVNRVALFEQPYLFIVLIKTLNSQFLILIVAPLGVEPRRTEPESAVLPLHNRAEKVAPTGEATFYIIN